MKHQQGGAPRAPRISVNQDAILVTSDGTQLNVVITELSARGFRLKACETFYIGENIGIGESVIIRIKRRDDIEAEIVWAAGCEAGGSFKDRSDHTHDEK